MRRFAAALFFSVLAAASAAAAMAQPAIPRESGQTSIAVFGMAGQGFHQELSRGQGFSEFGNVGVEASRFLSRRVEVQFELDPILLIRQPVGKPHGLRETVECFAIDVGARWFPAPALWNVVPYVEILDGPFYAVRRVPSGGTRFNFLTQAGFGAVLPLGSRWRPEVFGRWVHVSNAGIGRHNPDWDHWAIGVGGRIPVERRGETR